MSKVTLVDGAAQLAVLRSTYSSLKNDKLLCDIFFEIKSASGTRVDHYDLHRVVLYPFMADYISARTRVGSSSWFSGAGNSPKDRITLENFPGGKEGFLHVLSFCYLEESFDINIENVSALFYCSSYFGMTGEGNLCHYVANFIDSILLGTNHHKKAILFQTSVNFEQSNSLPCILSTKCTEAFADLIIKNSSNPKCLLSSSIIRLVRNPMAFMECLFSLHHHENNNTQKTHSCLALLQTKIAKFSKPWTTQSPHTEHSSKYAFFQALLGGLQLSRMDPELMRIVVQDLDDQIFPHEGPNNFIESIVTMATRTQNDDLPELQWVDFFKELKSDFQKDIDCSPADFKTTLSSIFYILGALLQTLLGHMLKKSGCSRENLDLKLVAAAMDGDCAVAAGLLAAGACPTRLLTLPTCPNEKTLNLTGEGKVSALHCAAYAAARSTRVKCEQHEARALATLALLAAAKGTDVNAPSSSGKTCLHFAAGAGRGAAPDPGNGGGSGGLSSRLLALLLALGADVNAGARVGTPLHVACWAGDHRAARLLLPRADVTRTSSLTKSTALHVLAHCAGEGPAGGGEAGWHGAAAAVDADAAAAALAGELLRWGADPGARDQSGATPMAIARAKGAERLVAVLQRAAAARTAKEWGVEGADEGDEEAKQQAAAGMLQQLLLEEETAEKDGAERENEEDAGNNNSQQAESDADVLPRLF